MIQTSRQDKKQSNFSIQSVKTVFYCVTLLSGLQFTLSSCIIVFLCSSKGKFSVFSQYAGLLCYTFNSLFNAMIIKSGSKNLKKSIKVHPRKNIANNTHSSLRGINWMPTELAFQKVTRVDLYGNLLYR